MQPRVGQTNPGQGKFCVLLTKLNHQEGSFPMNLLSLSLFVSGGERKMDPENEFDSFAASYNDFLFAHHTLTSNQKNVWEASGF